LGKQLNTFIAPSPGKIFGPGVNDNLRFIATGGIESAVKQLSPKDPPPFKTPEELDLDAAQAKEKERRRLSSGTTRRSASVAEALGGSIGKATLGGVA
jgi:hypothetical protein